ncbi:MAG: hypothetical protein ACK559_08190 [bacterium]
MLAARAGTTKKTTSPRCILIDNHDPITRLALTPRTQREAGIADSSWKYDSSSDEKSLKFLMGLTGFIFGVMLVFAYVT